MHEVEARHIWFTYEGASMPSLVDVSVSAERGFLIAVVGVNGGGKTTFIRQLNCLLKPQAGTLYVAGLDALEPRNLWDVRRACGMMFQNPENQFVSSLVGEDVEFGPLNYGVAPAAAARLAGAALDAVGLPDFEDRDVHDLSGGQQQRVALAGVLALEPAIIVLDEATSMLDPRGRADVLAAVEDVRARRGSTVIAATHDMEYAAHADRIVAISGGRVVAEGTPREVLGNLAALERCGLVAPIAVRVWERLVDMGVCTRGEGAPITFGDLARILVDGVSRAFDGARAGHAPTASHTLEPERDGAQSVAAASLNRLPASRAAFAMPSVPSSVNETPPARTSAASTGDIAVHPFHRIELDSVSAAYGDGPSDRAVPVLAGIHLSVHSGEVLGLMGQTGAGKSTLLEVVAGIIGPTSGRVLFDGCDIACDRRARRALRRVLGFAFQIPERQLFEVTVEREVGYALSEAGIREGELASRVREALGLVGLDYDELRHRSPFALSGGQQRRVALASMLALRPSVIMLDEPTAGLDPKGRDVVAGIVRSLREHGCLVLVASHDTDFLASCADRVAVLAAGRLVLDAPVRDALGDDARMRSLGLAGCSAARGAAEIATHGLPLVVGALSAKDLADGLAAALADVPRRSMGGDAQ